MTRSWMISHLKGTHICHDRRPLGAGAYCQDRDVFPLIALHMTPKWCKFHFFCRDFLIGLCMIEKASVLVNSVQKCDSMCLMNRNFGDKPNDFWFSQMRFKEHLESHIWPYLINLCQKCDSSSILNRILKREHAIQRACWIAHVLMTDQVMYTCDSRCYLNRI